MRLNDLLANLHDLELRTAEFKRAQANVNRLKVCLMLDEDVFAVAASSQLIKQILSQAVISLITEYQMLDLEVPRELL